MARLCLDKAAEDEEGEYAEIPLCNGEAAARYMDEDALRWLFLIHIKSSGWGTTAKSLT